MKNELNEKWHARFLSLAFFISGWSKDPSTKVGAVIVRPETRTIVSTGYNGLPRGVADTAARLQDREYKMMSTVHAEVNAIMHAARAGMVIEGCVLYCTWPPCNHCAPIIIQSGIKHVIIPRDVVIPDRWRPSFEHAERDMVEAGIVVRRMHPEHVGEGPLEP